MQWSASYLQRKRPRASKRLGRSASPSNQNDPGALPRRNGQAREHFDDQRLAKKNGYSFKRARRSLKDRRDETDFRHTQGLLSVLQQWEEAGDVELYYFDESGFSQSSAVPYAWSPVGCPLEVPAYSRSQRLNVLGFLSRQGKLIYHSTTETALCDYRSRRRSL